MGLGYIHHETAPSLEVTLRVAVSELEYVEGEKERAQLRLVA
jgi:hypothetical protein